MIRYKGFKIALTDEIDVSEDEQEHVLNFIHFFDCLDEGLFNEHKEDWVLVYKQKVVKYGEKKTDQLS
ncbi:hypothetical protein GLOIN_2v1474728 [Rhizophagus clarus]|uniref:Uncharacterized protein n=1 Tax=Rhizophagus clarus TaxID=94130 RepID=A0A8H3QL26_9GLOM|nr:hypothetical protein GLOIN_2v1474728 [Rhizophagus clarus]